MSQPSRLSGPLLFARSRAAGSLAVLVLGIVVIGSLVPGGLVAVPFRSDAHALILLVVVALPAAFVHLALRRPSAHVERTAQLRTARFVWWILATATLTLTATASVWARDGDVAIPVARNCLLLAGLTSVVARWAQPALAWLGATAFGGLCLTYGTIGPDGAPEAWALLLHPGTSISAWSVSAAVCLVGWFLYGRDDLAPPRA